MTQCSCISNAGEDVLNQSSFLFRSSPDGAFPPLRRGTEEAGPIGSLSVGSLPAPSPHRQVSRRGSAPVDRPEGGRQVLLSSCDTRLEKEMVFLGSVFLPGSQGENGHLQNALPH